MLRHEPFKYVDEDKLDMKYIESDRFFVVKVGFSVAVLMLLVLHFLIHWP